MPKESVLSITDKESIKIEKLIFHIILTDNVTPVFLEELDVTPEQQKFFRDRLADAAQGRQFIFTDDNPPIKTLADKLISNSGSDFLEISKGITSRFKSTHTQSSNNGVFIVSLASIGKRKLLFLIKLDHKKVYEYKLKGNKALLAEVKNTFSEDKTAIQKVALIDINPNIVWDVLVYDRSKPAGITDYFARFLSVLPRETDAMLTQKMQNTVIKWAKNHKSEIDPNQEPSEYKIRARNYLMNTDLFDTDEYIKAVIQDDDETRRAKQKGSFRQHLEESGLAGQTFSPKKDALTKKSTKNIRQTAEGVKMEWEGNILENNIIIPNSPDQNGNYIIKITTSDIEIIQ